MHCRLRLHLLCRSLAAQYFDLAELSPAGSNRSSPRMLDAFRKADDRAIIYSDVHKHVDRETELAEGLDLECKLLAKLKRGQDQMVGVAKTRLLPYQTQGVLFAACRGRVVLADGARGLGKAVQARAAAELLRRRKGIERVLVIAPASVKYQWKTEIEKFTALPAQAGRWTAGARRATPLLHSLPSPRSKLVSKMCMYCTSLRTNS